MKNQQKKEKLLRSYKQSLVLKKEPNFFIFGPEGGLSPAEIESFEAEGPVLAGLGPSILRAETAPLYVLSALSVLVELEK